MAPTELLRSQPVRAHGQLSGDKDSHGQGKEQRKQVRREAGKFANIIAIDGDPTQDINVIEKVVFVMKDGAIFKNDLAPKTNQGTH